MIAFATNNPDQPLIAENPKELRFSAYCWAMMLFLLKRSQTRVGIFGQCSHDDALLIEDVVVPRQLCAPCSIELLPSERIFRRGGPQQHHDMAGRIHHWIELVPNDGATIEESVNPFVGLTRPTPTWYSLCQITAGETAHARLIVNVGPGCEQALPVRVDFTLPFEQSDHAAWQREYESNVLFDDPFAPSTVRRFARSVQPDGDDAWCRSEWVAS